MAVAMDIPVAVPIPIGEAGAGVGPGRFIIQVSWLGGGRWWWGGGPGLILGLLGVGLFPTVASVSADYRAELL